MTFDRAAAERLREERKRLNLTQQQTAANVPCEQTLWSKYERFWAVPGGHVLAAFARQGANIDYILTGVCERPIPTADEAALLERWRLLDAQQQWLLRGMLALIRAAAQDTKPDPLFAHAPRAAALLEAFLQAGDDKRLAIEIAAGLHSRNARRKN